MKYICDVIRSTVPAVEVGKALGFAVGHDGRCRCPFHGGDHRNLKLYGANRGYYCFVCHEHGDVIRLVKEYTHCSFIEAIEWLNDSFGLHLDLHKDNKWSRLRRAERYAKQLAKENANAKSTGRDAVAARNP